MSCSNFQSDYKKINKCIDIASNGINFPLELDIYPQLSLTETRQRQRYYRQKLIFPQFFTLVELLVVIAIISILAALLLPTLSSALVQAKQTECASHHRQLGLAFEFYQTDFNCLPPGNSGFLNTYATNQQHWTNLLCKGGYINPVIEPQLTGGNERWQKNLSHGGIFVCPSLELGVSTTYGGGLGANRTHLLSFTENTWKNYILGKSITRPSQIVIVADSAPWNHHTKYIHCPGEYDWLSSTTEGVFSDRHGGNGNALYLDGHVENKMWMDLYMPKGSPDYKNINNNPWAHGWLF